MNLKNNNGVTLIELMIVLVIAAILIGGIYTLFNTQQRSYFVQDRVSGIQQDARAALDIMARDIRMAGFWTGAGSGTGFFGVGAIGGSNYAVNPGNGATPSTDPDQITVVLATEQIATVTNVSGSTVSLSGGVGGDGLNPNDYVAFEGETQVYQIQNINTPTANDIGLNGNPPNHLDNIGAHAYRVQAIIYNINGDSLQRNGSPLAGDGATTVVEDLQFAYQIEDDTNWYNAETDFPTGNSESDIRMVRINIIVRTAVPDPDETGFFKPACEDRGQENTFTGCRRRVYTTVVKVRNL